MEIVAILKDTILKNSCYRQQNFEIWSPKEVHLKCLFLYVVPLLHLRYMKCRELMKGISSKTLARRLKELERDGILERRAYNEIPPKVEYKLTKKGQELVESIFNLIHWMIK
jgi:DNA-binding HxlR family transcriptional regulator